MANVRTHTNMVHAPHPTFRPRGVEVPRCMSRSQVLGLHYTIPTEDPVDCRKCQNALARVAADQDAKAAKR